MDADDCYDIGMEDLAAAILANDIFSSPYGESGSTLTPMTDIQHRQLHTAQDDTSSDTAPDTQRQVVRDTPIYLSRHARRASRSVLGSSSEPGSVGRAGLTVAGLAILRARHMAEEMARITSVRSSAQSTNSRSDFPTASVNLIDPA